MAILLLPLCFISLFLILQSKAWFSTSSKENLLISVFVLSILLVFTTEALSAFDVLNYRSLAAVWGLITFLNLLYLYKHREHVIKIKRAVKNKLDYYKGNLSRAEKLLLLFATVMLLLIFIQGVAYPPNNWDSMTYHMARIVSWVSHQSVAHYPTHNLRQIYQPPFAEYVIMQVNILSKSDYFASSIQFFALLLSVVCVLLITESLQLSRPYKIIAVLLTVTIPEVILQASSTQNDLVTSFFCLAASYFVIKALNNCTIKNYLITGSIVGLGLLTKGTSYVYFAPLLLIWGLAALRHFYISKNYRYITYFVIAAVMAVSINAGFYYRNYSLNGNLLGISKYESTQYSNQKMGPVWFISSLVKNVGVHLGLKHVHGLSSVSNKAIHLLHAMAGVDINDPAVNFYHSKFSTNDTPSDEDLAPNLFHLLLILASFIVLFKYLLKHRLNAVGRLLLAVIIFQILLFCGYLKWQPWITRLHTPIFLLAVPLVCYAISLSRRLNKARLYFMPLIMLYAVMILLANRQRPYDKHLFINRADKFFIARDDIAHDYTQVKALLGQAHFKNIGLITNKDAWVYPLFDHCFDRELNPIYINVVNFTQHLPGPSNRPECIITTEINQPYIYYKGIRYYNKTGSNKSLFFYVDPKQAI